MKQGKLFTTLVMAALAAALAVYFGVYAFQALNAPYSTTVVYAYTVNDSAEADGLLAREEQVLPGQTGIVDLVRAEGERVGTGQNVALIYRDSQAQEDQAELDTLDREISMLEEAAAQTSDVQSAARLDEDILQAVVGLRASSALRDYSKLESQVLTIKSSVLKREYTYGDGLTAGDLKERIAQLKSRRAGLEQQSRSATTRVRAPQSGAFSSLVDGYEAVLTPASVFQLTPSALDGLMEAPPARDSAALGKLILGSRWYFVSALPRETADRLKEGETALLRFSGDFTQDVDMLVERIGTEEHGRVPVVFSAERHLSRTTLLRRQTAELIFEDFTGLRIPKEALRLVEEQPKADESASAPAQPVKKLGVYALVNGRVEFKGAEIAAEGGDYYVVRPTENGRKTLRAGDEIITRGTGLFEGQLLQN